MIFICSVHEFFRRNVVFVVYIVSESCCKCTVNRMPAIRTARQGSNRHHGQRVKSDCLRLQWLDWPSKHSMMQAKHCSKQGARPRLTWMFWKSYFSLFVWRSGQPITMEVLRLSNKGWWEFWSPFGAVFHDPTWVEWPPSRYHEWPVLELVCC